MMTHSASIMAETTAVAATPIPDCGRKIGYRGYLIHGEIPSICYIIYGRNDFGQLAELGTVSGFTEAMGWVDRHIAEMEGMLPVDAPTPPAAPALARLPRAA